MSRAKKTKKQKQYSLIHRYRQIGELLNHAKKVQSKPKEPT